MMRKCIWRSWIWRSKNVSGHPGSGESLLRSLVGIYNPYGQPFLLLLLAHSVMLPPKSSASCPLAEFFLLPEALIE